MTVNDELSFTVQDITESGERIVRFEYQGAFEDCTNIEKIIISGEITYIHNEVLNFFR